MDVIDQAAALYGEADGLPDAAGAGMGVDSGLPGFRGETAFWRAYPALADARLAWGFYGPRLDLYRRTVALIRINPRDAENQTAHGVSIMMTGLAALQALAARLESAGFFGAVPHSFPTMGSGDGY